MLQELQESIRSQGISGSKVLSADDLTDILVAIILHNPSEGAKLMVEVNANEEQWDGVLRQERDSQKLEEQGPWDGLISALGQTAVPCGFIQGEIEKLTG